VVSKPAGAADPAFGASGTNAAKSSGVTFAAAGSYTLRVTIANAGGASVTSDLAVAVNAAAAAPAVEGVSVNDAAPQRSMVTRVAVTFTTAVTPAAGAFTLTRRGDGGAVGLTAANPSGDGRTWVLTFSGAGVTGGSLADGVYDLLVKAALVADGSGRTMAGGDYAMALHRLFGDGDGDRDVDSVDSLRFKQAQGSALGDAAYRAWFDFDADGDVDSVDSLRFKQRQGSSLNY
jgi:hypothetical protein